MNLSQAKPTPKQLNLNKLSDAGGSQIHWQATLAKNDSSSDFGIYQKSSKIGIIRSNIENFNHRERRGHREGIISSCAESPP